MGTITNHILGICQISCGKIKECFVNKRTIGQFLLLSGAEEFIVIHNHPNGSKKASEQDIASAAVLQVFGDTFSVVLIADICIGKNGWTNCLKKYDNKVEDNRLPYV